MAKANIAFETAWGIATETTYGTAVAPAGFIPFNSESLAKEREVIEPVTSQSRFQQEMIGDASRNLGRTSVGGDVAFNVEPVNFGYVLKHALGTAGAPTLVATGVYDHAFKAAATLSPFTSQFRVNSSYAKRVTGGMMDSLSLDFADDILTASASMKAKDLEIIGTPATITYPTQRPYTFQDATFTVGASGVTGQVTSGSIQISNNLIDDDFRQGSVTVEEIYPGAMSVEGSLDMVYDPAATGDVLAWTDTNTPKDLTVKYTGNTISGANSYDLTVKLPRSIVTAASPSMSAGEKITRTVNFRGFYDPTQADPNKAISMTLRNARSTAY